MVNKANIITILVTLVFLIAGSSTTTMGRIIYVDGDAIGTYDGSSWAHGYRCLQDALTRVRLGDEIRVANGVYRPDRKTSIHGGRGGGETEYQISASSDRMATFEVFSGVTMKGGYAGYGEPNPNSRDFVRYETILSGDLNANDIDVNDADELQREPCRAENSYHVVTTLGGGVLDGFTITSGNADGDYSDNRDGFEPFGRIDTPQINVDEHSYRDGGGLFNQYGTPQISNCVFTDNSAMNNGGGIYNDVGSSTINNCTFTGNWALNNGGGIYNDMGSSTINNCTFTGNLAENGGGLYNDWSNPTINNCVFSGNSARDYGGGGIYNGNSNPTLTNCTFSENIAYYGGGVYSDYSRTIFTKCAFLGNMVRGYGGGIYNTNDSIPILNNCVFSGNSARDYGGGMSCNNSDSTLTNCTFAGNRSETGDALAYNSRGQSGQSIVEISNCIFWDGPNEIWINDRTTINIFYSNVRGGWPGEGNIDADPLFENRRGLDGIPGTEDDNLQPIPLSPCIDAGDPNYAPELNETDIGGNQRVISGRIDMGAYELQPLIYVDDDAPYETPLGEEFTGYPEEDGTPTRPFNTIQEAIDIAENGFMVLVRPGVYDKIDFGGKAITVAGTEGAAVIEAQSEGLAGEQDAVTFHTGEGRDSMLKNFVIRNSGIAISINYSNPTLRNVTIADNNFGIAAYDNSDPDISNCILWNNRDGDLFQCETRYSCIESGAQGEGNLNANPLFVDEANGDYHLKSEGWRWNASGESWTYDQVTSRCIDAGDPDSPLGDELMRVPRDPHNMFGVNLRLNMGAFGGTYQASMPPLGWMPLEDITAPEPNPAQWAPGSAPQATSRGGRTYAEWTMTAVEATDDSGLVEYFFKCTTNPALSSGWQRSRTYSVSTDRSVLPDWGDTVLNQRFRVKARDLYGNETAWSEEWPPAPGPEEDTTAPTPNPARWAQNGEPHEVNVEGGTFDYYIEMEAEEATDASGFVNYYFECTTDSDLSSGWQSSPTYSIPVGRRGQGLRFHVKARDLYGNETAWSEELPVQPPMGR